MITEKKEEQTIEEWKQIKDFPRYYVSNLGNVKSTIGKEKQLQPTICDDYEYIMLYDNKTKRKENKRLHRLVAQYFCENFSASCEVHHKNKDTTDNRAINLQCLTAAEHQQLHKELKQLEAASKSAENAERANI